MTITLTNNSTIETLDLQGESIRGNRAKFIEVVEYEKPVGFAKFIGDCDKAWLESIDK